MGLWDWLRGGRRKAEGPAAPEGMFADRPEGRPAPEIVGELGPGSPFVMVKLGQAVMMTDRDTYDYRYGTSTLPDPSRADLEALLPRVDRVRALSGGIYRGAALESAVLLDTDRADDLAAFRACFAIVEDPATFGHCACLGGPTLELFEGTARVATIGLQHGNAIRWDRWRHDARLRDGGRLDAWLTGHGVAPALLTLLYSNPLPFSGGRLPGRGPEPLSVAEQRLLMAEIEAGRGGLDAALAACDELLADEPELGPAYATRGLLRADAGRHAEAVADLSAAVARGENRAEILHRRAVALDHLGRPDDAIADCTAALALDPDHAASYNSRGLIRRNLGRLDEALADLDAAVRLAPDWELPYLHRAQVYQFRGDLAPALADYDRVIAAMEARRRRDEAPTLARLLWNRSRAHLALGDRARAEADRRAALKLDPSAVAE